MSLRNTSLYISSMACVSIMKMYNFPSHSHSVTLVLLLALRSALWQLWVAQPLQPHLCLMRSSSWFVSLELIYRRRKICSDVHQNWESQQAHPLSCFHCFVLPSLFSIFPFSFNSLSHIEIYKIWPAIMHFSIIFIKYLLSAFIIMVNTYTHVDESIAWCIFKLITQNIQNREIFWFQSSYDP